MAELIYLIIGGLVLFVFFYAMADEPRSEWTERIKEVGRETTAKQDELLRRTIDRLRGLE